MVKLLSGAEVTVKRCIGESTLKQKQGKTTALRATLQDSCFKFAYSDFCTYLAHHELESGVIIFMIVVVNIITVTAACSRQGALV